ncbi:hypothetical protein UlMin_044862 [Ulmus minor]
MLKMFALFSLLIVFNNLHCLAKRVSYTYLVVQWSSAVNSYCRPTYGTVVKNFSIHGVWPNDMSGASIWSCDPKNQFNEKKVSMLVRDMQVFWSSITYPSTNSRQFWSHEWSKHMTCSGLIQFDYFDKTLQLKDRANILKALRNAGIKPGSSYPLDDMEKVVEVEIGFSPIIMYKNCLLKEIYICVDSYALTFIACPAQRLPVIVCLLLNFPLKK